MTDELMVEFKDFMGKRNGKKGIDKIYF